MSAALTARIAEDFAAAQALAPAPAEGRRRAAFEVLHAAGLPSTRDENWKYANLRALERLRFVPAAAAAPQGLSLPAPLEGFSRYVFVDGRFAPEFSAAAVDSFASLAAGPQALSASPLAGARGTDERFALLNEAFATDGARVHLAAGVPAQRLEVIFVACADGARGTSYPRLEVSLGAHTQLELIERHLSAAGAASTVDSVAVIELARGARLTHYRLQGLSGSTIAFDTLQATLAEDTVYRLHGVSTGAAAARSTQILRLTGARAHLSMALAALGDRQQVQDTFALVEHRAPHTRTEQLFRGIAAGRARVACNGKIVVAPTAAGTDSQQSLRGLLAGTDAEIDVRPQLEIYTDDVRCSHGATAGKLDDNMLFYLLARGLDRDTALRLLKWAFLADAFAKIELPELRRQIEASLAEVLKDAALKELL
ncbi:MAG TPA: SufD family Fe-S cluster assembly protein [Steroidobacteraceae bacterium]|nr:SufD family Fe-S cluster assembly protein [Steroidobacteraceae bacterium]